jgi:hypothetical protein
MAFSKKFEVARARRIIKRCMVVCWSFGMVSLLALGYIETAAIWQPKEPDAVYRFPRQIKGTIRYITGGQKRILSIAIPCFVGGLAGFFLLAIPYEGLKRREEERRNQRLRDSEWPEV